MSENAEEYLSDEFEKELTESVLPPSDIHAYTELRSCADIYRMYKTNQLNVEPDFQRGMVWTDKEQTEFIDSLAKKLPIPSLCFSYDHNTEKYDVIDGSQRTRTIIRFLDKENWKLNKLEDIYENISDKTVKQIRKDHPQIYARIENLTIPITVIRYDRKKESHLEYIFTVFHRLNSGGRTLTNQEIRNAIYNGKLNDLLAELDKNEIWMKILNIKDNKNYRGRFEELILRFFSFYYNHKNYKGKLTSFLNDFMYNRKNIKDEEIEKYRRLFNDTLNLASNLIEKLPSQKGISKLFVETLLLGIAFNKDQLAQQKDTIINKYDDFERYWNTLGEELSGGTLIKNKVESRLKRTREIFS